MKIRDWILSGTWALGVALLLSACGSKPGIELLSTPVARTAGADVVFDGKSYSPGTKAVLKQEGLSQLVRKDPVAVIQQLAQRLRSGGGVDVRLAAAEVAMNQAIQSGGVGTKVELGYLLTAIELSEAGLAPGTAPQQADLHAVYNEANAELAWLLHQQTSGKEKIKVSGPLKHYVLSWRGGRYPSTQPGFYDTLTPASRIEVKGFDEVNVRPGFGGSLVAYRETTEARRAKDPFMPISGYAIALTAVVNLGKNGSAELVLHDVKDEEAVSIRGKSYPLRGDFTAAVATVQNSAPRASAGWVGMMRPKKEGDLTGLYTLSPHRADRIPLILVHGLLSTPSTWLGVLNACYGDPVIRGNYQVMVFFYPTGYSIPQNAASLRAKLKAYQQLHDPRRSNPKMRKMVMVGHSMGCNLTNFQIRDGGDDYWDVFFTKSIGELEVDPVEKDQFRRNIYFKANPDIDRVIFICGPHRGSPLSDAWIGRFGASLIRLPFHAVDHLSGNAMNSATALGQSVFDEPTSSINNLEANSPVLLALLKQPIPHDPKIHSIIGDRGKASGVGSSDGVVPYWSAHLDGVESEQFIPASHTQATNNPENVEMVRAILYEHVGKKLPVAKAAP